MYECSNCGKTYTREQVGMANKSYLTQISCGRCKTKGSLKIGYKGFSKKIFEMIRYTSLSYIEIRLHKLSEDFKKPYSEVVSDFNKETGNFWEVKEK